MLGFMFMTFDVYLFLSLQKCLRFDISRTKMVNKIIRLRVSTIFTRNVFLHEYAKLKRNYELMKNKT